MSILTGDPVLKVSGLLVRRGRTVILDGVDWAVARGEHWVILGANGSGKTSLLNVLAGYLMPTAGEVNLLGRRYGRTDWRELRKRIGFVSSSVRQMMAEEEPALETVVSGKYAMIDFRGRLNAMDRRRAKAVLRQIECLHLAERPWRVLSQGERQRLLIGRALMARPRLLILDEPCAGLDPASREHFLQFIERLGRNNRMSAIVLVTHHVEEVMPVFSHALVLKGGRVLASGEKKKVFNGKVLSEAFSARLHLRREAGRYTLAIAKRAGRVM